MSLMKIALLIDDRYPHSGGTTRVVERLAQHLTASGHTNKIFCPSRSRPDAPGAQLVRTVRLPTMAEGTLYPSAQDKALLLDYKPDVIHTHSERGAFTWARQASRDLGVPHVHTFHADYSVLHPYYPLANVLSWWLAQQTKRLTRQVSIPPNLDGYYEPNERFLRYDWLNMARFAANTDYYTTPSPRIFHFFERVGLADHGQLIPFGIDPIWFTDKLTIESRSEPPVIMSVGRLDAEKRVDVIIEAFRLLRKSGVDARLRIVGTGTVAAKLQNQAMSTGFGDDITFHGLVKSDDDLRALYRSASMFALGSYHYETQGLVLLEAAAAGLPIVYSDARLEIGVVDANSLLVSPEASSYAQAFTQLCQDDQRRRQMGLASLTEARRYPLNTFFSSMIKGYERAVTELRTVGQ